MPANDVRAVLTGSTYSEQVRDDEAKAGRCEITSVPTFLVDERLVIPGARCADSMLASLRRAWHKQPAQAWRQSRVWVSTGDEQPDLPTS